MVDFAGQTGMDQYQYSLGTPTAEYKPRSVAPLLRLFFGFIIGVASVFMILYGAASSQVSGDDRTAIIIIGSLMAVFAWVMIEFWLKARGLVVQVFTDGLVRSQYGKTFVARWDEIASVWQKVTRHYSRGVW